MTMKHLNPCAKNYKLSVLEEHSVPVLDSVLAQLSQVT